jgi:hypothetical protein
MREENSLAFLKMALYPGIEYNDAQRGLPGPFR